MHKFEYVVQQDGDGFQISSYDTINDIKNAPHIELTICRCSSGNERMDAVEIASLDDQSTAIHEDFAQHYVEVLQKQNRSWALVGALINAGCVQLEYYCQHTDRTQNITLDINGTRATALEMTFEVHHADHRLPTKYNVSMKHGRTTGRSDAIIEVHLPYQKKIFMLMSDHPDEISITECIDL